LSGVGIIRDGIRCFLESRIKNSMLFLMAFREGGVAPYPFQPEGKPLNDSIAAIESFIFSGINVTCPSENVIVLFAYVLSGINDREVMKKNYP